LLRGREAVITEIVQNCRAGRFIVITAQSGMGVISLLHAGVVRALRREGAIVVTFRDWQGRFFSANLKEAAAHAVRVAADDMFFAEGEDLAELLKRVRGRTEKPVVFLLDQFEDYLRCHTHTMQSDLFDAEFARAVTDREGVFVVGLQEHAIPAFERLEAHIPNLLGYRVQLEALSVDAAREAVLSEAALKDMQVEPAALQAILTAPILTGVPASDASLTGPAPSATIARDAAAKVTGTRGSGKAAIRRVAVRESKGAHPFYLKLATEDLVETEALRKSRVLSLSAIEFRGGVDHVVFESVDAAIQELGKTQTDLLFRWCTILISPDKERLSVTEKGLTEYAGRLNRFVAALLPRLMEMGILRSLETPEAIRYEIARECYAPILQDWWERRDATIVARRRAVFRITSISVAAAAIVIVYLVWLIFSPK
jgi:hypothetical protein